MDFEVVDLDLLKDVEELLGSGGAQAGKGGDCGSIARGCACGEIGW